MAALFQVVLPRSEQVLQPLLLALGLSFQVLAPRSQHCSVVVLSQAVLVQLVLLLGLLQPVIGLICQQFLDGVAPILPALLLSPLQLLQFFALYLLLRFAGVL
jgi:hypothetical protein